MNGLESISSWFTPTVLFCFLNLTILSIFFLNPNKKQQYPPLIRFPSLFDRSRSINRSDPESTRFVPSLIERVRSIKFSARPDPVHREELVHERIFPVYHEDPVQEHIHPVHHEDLVQEHVYPVHREEPVQEQVRPVHHEEPVQEHVHRTKSETVRKVKKQQVAKKVLKRSVSEKAPLVEKEEVVYQRQPDTVREKAPVALAGDEEVDGKADDFINKFRQQLKLQRLDSILRYNEMLNRGASR